MAEAQNKPVEGTENTAATAVEQIDPNAEVVMVVVEQKFKAPRKTIVEAAIKKGETPPTARAPFSTRIPHVTWKGLLAKIDNAKVQDFILSLVNGAIDNEARAQIQDDEKPVNSDSELDKSKLDLVYIANLSAADRAGSSSITPEDLKAFAETFASALPAMGFTGDQAKMLAQVFKSKFAAYKQKPDRLVQLRVLLNKFVDGTPPQTLEPHGDTIEYLDGLLEKFINKPETDKLAEMFENM